MSALGWSYPAGCSGSPFDGSEGAIDITTHAVLPTGVTAVFWDEGGNLLEGRKVTYAADDVMPQLTETVYHRIGTHEWDDSLTDSENVAEAGRAYNAIRAAITKTDE